VHGWFTPVSYGSLFAVILLTGLGLPIPEDAVVLAGGYLVHTGATRLGPTMAVALASAVAGDVLLYLAGRRFGERVVGHRRFARLVSPARVERARRFFHRWGGAAVLVGRFVMGLRAAVFLTAGTLRMSFPRFFFINLAGALASVPLLVWLGAWGGDRIDRFAAAIAHARWAALLAVALAAAVAVGVARWRSRGRA
jgi:membrane protein DedA with SNARE-associated domain